MPINLYPLTKGWNDAQWDMRKEALFDVQAPAEAAKADYLANAYFPNQAIIDNQKTANYMALQPSEQWKINDANQIGSRTSAQRALQMGDYATAKTLAAQGGITLPELDTPDSRTNASKLLGGGLDYRTGINQGREVAIDTQNISHLYPKNSTSESYSKTQAAVMYKQQSDHAHNLRLELKDIAERNPGSPRVAALEKELEDIGKSMRILNDIQLGTTPTSGAQPAPSSQGVDVYAARARAFAQDRINAGLPPLTTEQMTQLVQMPEAKTSTQLTFNQPASSPVAPASYAATPAPVTSNVQVVPPQVPPAMNAVPAQQSNIQQDYAGIGENIDLINKQLQSAQMDYAKLNSLDARRYAAPETLAKIQTTISRLQNDKAVLESKREAAYRVASPFSATPRQSPQYISDIQNKYK